MTPLQVATWLLKLDTFASQLELLVSPLAPSWQSCHPCGRAEPTLKSSTSTTARTLAELHRLGYLAEVVEKRLPKCWITPDLFGCINGLAVRAGESPLGIQCTSGSNAAARVSEAVATPALRTWLAVGCRFEVWSWRLLSRTRRYELTRQPLAVEDRRAPPIALDLLIGKEWW